MIANPGEGPGYLIEAYQRFNPPGFDFESQLEAIWPFSFRHFSRYGKSRRLTSRYTDASCSYGKSESGLDLAGRRRKAERPARIRGKSARSEAKRAKRRRRGRLL